ncbi:hypothetical protein, partial [uncultured Phascolarctobacterium sp.]|uniref:hypothetical protein n=1 Tax=uncultured Phascolarctobacterium sp. TaxID=512296 RepID=UPI002619833B
IIALILFAYEKIAAINYHAFNAFFDAHCGRKHDEISQNSLALKQCSISMLSSSYLLKNAIFT